MGIGIAALMLRLCLSAPDSASEAPAAHPDASSTTAPPATVTAEITVTAHGVPTPLRETPAAVTVLDAEELEAAVPLALDDVLRQVPGFTLFRRSGSRTANPTTQGPSLRGLGGSGASRALVLADGVPLNDPFGGWVAWGRVPRIALSQVEVLRGGASDLYGAGALAGVVQLLRRSAAPGGLAPGDLAPGDLLLEAAGGEQRTAAFELWAARRRGRWGASLAGERFTTAGAVPVARDERGAVDVPAGSRHSSVEATVERAFAGPRSGGRLVLRGSNFTERRANGTPQQWNDTELDELVAGADLPVRGGDGRDGHATVRLWSTRETYEQTFSVVAPDRGSEVRNREQRVPSWMRGALARWALPLGDRTTLIAGLEARRTRGESDERALAAGRVTTTAAGGRQDAGGFFVEALLAPHPRWSLAAGLRADDWENTAGPIPPSTSPSAPAARRRERAVSPRLSLRFQTSDAWSLSLAGYRSFRAPTLNELYRGFRVGNVVTDPNPRLGPERLAGVELGAGWTGAGAARPRLAATLYWMELSDAIANVTVTSAPDLVRRRRENLGRTRARGLEIEGAFDATPRLRVAGAWQLVESTVESFDADPLLVGRRVAQVPQSQATASLRWRGAALDATFAARWSGAAFDDDRNTLRLDGFTVVDAEAARSLPGGFALFVAAENLLDETYVVGRAGVTTVGSPRLVRAGVRYRIGG